MDLSTHSHGKGHVRVVKLKRHTNKEHDFRQYCVEVKIFGETEESYSRGDNWKVVATDSVKNIIYSVAEQHPICSKELFGVFICEAFFLQYPDCVSRCEVRIEEELWERVKVKDKFHSHVFRRKAIGGESGSTFCEVESDYFSGGLNDLGNNPIQITSGVKEFTLLKTTQSSWCNFVKDDYRTLPDTEERMLASAMDITWKWEGGFVSSSSSTAIPVSVPVTKTLSSETTQSHTPSVTGSVVTTSRPNSALPPISGASPKKEDTSPQSPSKKYEVERGTASTACTLTVGPEFSRNTSIKDLQPSMPFIRSCRSQLDQFEVVNDKIIELLTVSFAGPVEEGLLSLGVQETVYIMAKDTLKGVNGDKKTLSSLSISAPNLHNIPVNVVESPANKKDGGKQTNRDSFGFPHVLVSTQEPHGIISITMDADAVEEKDIERNKGKELFLPIYESSPWIMEEACKKFPEST